MSTVCAQLHRGVCARAGSYGVTNLCLHNVPSCSLLFIWLSFAVCCATHIDNSSRRLLYLVSAYQMLSCAVLMT